jgi:MFS family permease
MSIKVVSDFYSRIFYGWRMVGLVSLIRVVGGGLHQFGFTVFFLPISQDLEISRAATSLAFSLSRAQGAVTAPLVGYFIDRHGPRPILVTAVFLAGIGYILLSWVTTYTGFMIVYLGVICLAFIAGFVHSPPSPRHDGRERGRTDRRRIDLARVGARRRFHRLALGRLCVGLHFSSGLPAFELSIEAFAGKHGTAAGR